MRRVQYLLAGMVLLLAFDHLAAQPLYGTDELGRTLIQNDEAGNPKPNRHIALFYFLWQGDKGSPTSPRHWDLGVIEAAHPEVFANSKDSNWGGAVGSYYYWGQPVYGYYRGDDYWVHLRNIQLLTDAGVDLLVLDATNTITYPLQSEVLMQAIDAVRAQGKTPPAVVFYTNTASGKTMQAIYDQFYKQGARYRHPGCWFYLEGKPLIIGVTKEAAGTSYQSFFTFREAQWPNVPAVTNGWPWISFTRKPEVYMNTHGEKEIANVSVAQHPDPAAGMGGSAFYGNTRNWGRSYHNNHPGNPAKDIRYGYNIQEQWDAVLKEQLPFIFVTGWNEWIAGRWKSTDGDPRHSYFCDQASPEYSREIEPTRTAGLNDNYYMQLVNNIRRYKGVEKNRSSAPVKNMNGLSSWKKIALVYTDYTGDTKPRNHPGAQSAPLVSYTNTTGRNDFRLMKVAHGKTKIFFYAETVNNITPVSGDNWMRLYLDWDCNAGTGWNGYDYRIVEGTMLQQYRGHWVTINSNALKKEVNGNHMMITVPMYLLNGMSSKGFEFKWTDNMQKEDPMDWYINGDAAPGGRFNYRYTPE
ncbi:MAG: hypothetical protein J7539_04510 [Niabella sp.]|nr:hypothetical protein [Niabella sp.]